MIWIAKCINTFFATEIEKNSQRLVGINAENGEINEGLVRFDIVFYCFLCTCAVIYGWKKK